MFRLASPLAKSELTECARAAAPGRLRPQVAVRSPSDRGSARLARMTLIRRDAQLDGRPAVGPSGVTCVRASSMAPRRPPAIVVPLEDQSAFVRYSPSAARPYGGRSGTCRGCSRRRRARSRTGGTSRRRAPRESHARRLQSQRNGGPAVAEVDRRMRRGQQRCSVSSRTRVAQKPSHGASISGGRASETASRKPIGEVCPADLLPSDVVEHERVHDRQQHAMRAGPGR